jgi:hypothetical protein
LATITAPVRGFELGLFWATIVAAPPPVPDAVVKVIQLVVLYAPHWQFAEDAEAVTGTVPVTVPLGPEAATETVDGTVNEQVEGES